MLAIPTHLVDADSDALVLADSEAGDVLADSDALVDAFGLMLAG